VIFDRRVFDELRAAPLDAGARLVVRAHWDESIDVPVSDRGSLRDIDTPADYQQLREELR
jgi:CTP:molybdopterin cytidylyltransferase MocA